MQYKQTAVRLFFLLLPVSAFSQTTFLPQGAQENILIERMEIKQRDSALQYLKTKPYSRRVITQWAEELYSNTERFTALSNTDRFNLQQLLIKNSEWTT